MSKINPLLGSRGFTFRELEVLRAVIQEGKTTAAAHHLGISQPAVSRTIAQIEARTKRQLFERAGGRLTPTSAGLALNEQANPIFETLKRLDRDDWGSRENPRLRLHAPPTLAQALLPHLVRGFLELYPEVSLQVEIGASASIITAVANENADLGITDGLAEHNGLTPTPYRRAYGHALFPEGHPLAERDVIYPEDFHQQNFIALTRRFSVRNVYDRIFTAHNVERKIVVETATSYTLCEFVRKGLGIALVNPFPITLQPQAGLVIRPFHPKVPYTTSFFTPTGRTSTLAKRFVEYARENPPLDTNSEPL